MDYTLILILIHIHFFTLFLLYFDDVGLIKIHIIEIHIIEIHLCGGLIINIV